MRLDLNMLGNAAGTEASQQSQSSGKPVRTGAPPESTTVSETLTSVRSLKAAAMDQPEVREAMVASLRKAVSNGEYELNPEQIAAAMIRERQG